MGKYIRGQERGQLVLFNECIEDRIEAENVVRVIDLYVESINLEELGFKNIKPKEKGTNKYNPKDILKLYIYGYRNKVRSSRKLAQLCKTNIEVMWLMKGLEPDFRTISEFRRRNIKELKQVYKDMIIMCTEIGIIGDEYSQDGVKIEAVNSKERNYTLNKIDEQIKRIERKIEEYMKEIEETDKKEEKKEEKFITEEKLKERIEKKKKREEELKKIRKEMEERKESQKSLTDKDSKLMKNNGKFSVCYNNQVVVDTKSHIVVNYEVDNKPADSGSMEKVMKEAKETTKKEIVKDITDKGYNDREDMRKCLEEGIIPEVTLPEGKEYYEIEMEYENREIKEEEIKSKKEEEIRKVLKAGKIPEVYKEYIKEIEIVEKWEKIEEKIEEGEEEIEEEDIREYAMKNKCFMRIEKKNKVYCPEGESLRQKSESRGRKNYCNKEGCKRCKNPCTKSKYKVISFGEGQRISTPEREKKKSFPQERRKEKRKKIKKVKFKLIPKEEELKKRMGTSEHIHGTMKRSDDASYFLLKGKEKVNGEMAIYYTASNLRRIINIVGVSKLKEILEKRIRGEKLEMIQ